MPMREGRRELLERATAEGWTLQKTGDALGVTRERARQLLVKAGLRTGSLPPPPWRNNPDRRRAAYRVYKARWRAANRAEELAQRRAAYAAKRAEQGHTVRPQWKGEL